ncbi:hypothetical protein B0H11DRAFT_1901720 [Mycena galericulata]|nr:hypothetical protein B0H11DRAFT_1901720 [Mycena galericulata]
MFHAIKPAHVGLSQTYVNKTSLKLGLSRLSQKKHGILVLFTPYVVKWIQPIKPLNQVERIQPIKPLNQVKRLDQVSRMAQTAMGQEGRARNYLQAQNAGELDYEGQSLATTMPLGKACTVGAVNSEWLLWVLRLLVAFETLLSSIAGHVLLVRCHFVTALCHQGIFPIAKDLTSTFPSALALPSTLCIVAIGVWSGGLAVFALRLPRPHLNVAERFGAARRPAHRRHRHLDRISSRLSFNYRVHSSLYPGFIVSRFPVPLPAFPRCCASHHGLCLSSARGKAA